MTEKKILSGHDVSDGGLATCLVEMAISGLCGLCVTLNGKLSSTTIRQSAVDELFAEECGWVLECDANDVSDIVAEFKNAGVLCSQIGFTESTGMDARVRRFIHFRIEAIDLKVHS